MDHKHHHAEHSHSIPHNQQAVCPVTGDIIDSTKAEEAGHIRVYNGKKVYFCCAGCVAEFDKKPGDYIAHENH